MIYVFHGDDTFSAHEALRDILQQLGPEDMRDSNMSQIDGASFDLQLFGGAAMVVPFLAPRRLVVVRGLLATAEGQRATGRGRRGPRRDAEAPWAGLVDLLGQLPPTTDVVFLDGRLGRGNALLGEIQALGKEAVQVREFPALRRDALARWIRERAEKKGATIKPDAVALLADHVGGNLWTMDGELEKLAIYCSGRPIEASDVEALVSASRESSVFDLVDRIMERRTDAALVLMERMLEAGATGPYLLTMIARQVRLVALAQELLRQRVSQSEWGAKLAIQQDFVLRKTMDQARRFTPDAIRQFYRLLLEADLAMKTGDVSDELALTEALARAGTVRAAGRR